MQSISLSGSCASISGLTASRSHRRLRAAVEAQRSSRNHRARLAAAIEPLERRLLLTSVVVNTTADSTDAPGSTVVSLRDAVNIANNSTTAATITFSPTVFATAQTITLVNHDLELSAKQPVTVTAPAAGLTVNGNSQDLDFLINKGVTATMSGLTITGGNGYAEGAANVAGGAIENNGALTLKGVSVTASSLEGSITGAGGIDNTGILTITNSTVANNTGGADGIGGFGGGITNESGATLSLTNDTVSGNSGSAVGGIYNLGAAALSDVTISGNHGIGFFYPEGGGSGDGGGIGNFGKTTLTNCTISGNSNYGSGAGIGNFGALTLADSTISSNDGNGLHIARASSSTVVANTIIAANLVDSGGNVDGAVQSSGYNLIGDTTGSTGWKSTDLTGTAAHPLNAMLSPLGPYGGPTQTQVPLPGSPAIGAGSVALIPPAVTADQRGVARVVNGKVDIGSVELQAASTITITTPNYQQDVLAGVPTSIMLGSFTDPAGKGPDTGVVIWGDGSPDNSFSVSAVGSLGSLTHTFTTNRSFAGTIIVSDGSGDVSSPGAVHIASAGISGTVFQDDNGDGTEETGEIGLGGVQVYADLGNVGHFVNTDPTATTDGNGVYTFQGLASGNYIIRQMLPSGFKQTYPATGLGLHVTLNVQRYNPPQNFGDQSTQGAQSYINGTVFNDANGDGTQDNGETGIAGVQVYADLGNVGYFVAGDPTFTTIAGGAYTLSNLPAGNYIIRQVLPSGYTQTAPSGGLGVHLHLPANYTLTGANVGDKPIATPTATVTGTVFNDANSDGAQDNGETGLAGVQVYADLGNVGYFVAGDPTTTTNATGGFTLPGLAAGNYVIRQVRPSGDTQTTPANGLGRHVTVFAGQTLSGENFGDKATTIATATITGTVFNDANGDGIEDDGETGLAGIQVYLDLGNVGYFVNGDPTTTTTGSGGYTLSGLAAGNYIVRQVPPTGYVQTTPSSGYGHHVTVATGQTLSQQNFGDKA